MFSLPPEVYTAFIFAPYLRDLPDGYVVTPKEVENKFKEINHELSPLEIVVVNTRAGSVFDEPDSDYLEAGVGMGREATLYLLERGVKVVGTDAWSWDAPFKYTRERFAATGDPSIIWEGHKAGRDIGYGQIEKLSNLEKLPNSGFLISCFPYKIKHTSAGFVRAVAFLPKQE